MAVLPSPENVKSRSPAVGTTRDSRSWRDRRTVRGGIDRALARARFRVDGNPSLRGKRARDSSAWACRIRRPAAGSGVAFNAGVESALAGVAPELIARRH